MKNAELVSENKVSEAIEEILIYLESSVEPNILINEWLKYLKVP